MFDQAFNAIDNALRTEAGCTTELDYTEQTSWLLFLRYLDGMEQDRADEAKLEGKRYTHILEKPYRWETWAAPKGKDGTLDHNAAMTGDDLVDFVNDTLFPYLQKFTTKASGPDTIEYKIGQVFAEIKNKITSGYTLREVIDAIDALRFRSQVEKHELSQIYEEKIKRMGNAGRNGGEYYTPRPLIRAMIKVVNPQIGETIYDPACGSAGFLCEAFDYLNVKGLTTKDAKILQEKTFTGKEKKSLAYVIAIMNMILHGIEAPKILHVNTLTENLADVQEKDRFDIILANPPFGGSERKEVQQNFPIRTGETAYLFLQHFIKMLKAGGRAAIVIKSTFLSNEDAGSVEVRKLLLDSCSLDIVLDLPRGVFAAGPPTVVLFFTKGSPTRDIWFYKLDLDRNLGKTQPLNDADLADFLALHKNRPETDRSWTVDTKTIDPTTADLSIKGRGPGRADLKTPQTVLGEIEKAHAELLGTLGRLRALPLAASKASGLTWTREPLGDLCDVQLGRTPARKSPAYWDPDKRTDNVWLSIADLLSAEEGIVLDSREYLSAAGAKITPLVRKGTLLVSFKLTLGRLAFAGRDLRTNEAIAALTIRDPRKLSAKYLFHFLRYFDWDKAAESDEKLKGKTLNKGKVAAIPIAYPSRPEQDRIVTMLEHVSEQVSALAEILERNEESIAELERSFLGQAFAGA